VHSPSRLVQGRTRPRTGENLGVWAFNSSSLEEKDKISFFDERPFQLLDK